MRGQLESQIVKPRADLLQFPEGFGKFRVRFLGILSLKCGERGTVRLHRDDFAGKIVQHLNIRIAANDCDLRIIDIWH